VWFDLTLRVSSSLSPLSLHDALPIWRGLRRGVRARPAQSLADRIRQPDRRAVDRRRGPERMGGDQLRAARHERRAQLRLALLRRSEEHTSELQSRENLVCRLLLEKKK